MNADENDTRESEPAGAEEGEEPSFTSGGGPAAAIYGEEGDEDADRIGEEMLKAPDESSRD